MEEEYKKCLKIHGVFSSESDSDSDESKLELDEEYEIYKPCPIKIDPQKHKIIEVHPSENCPKHKDTVLSYADALKGVTNVESQTSRTQVTIGETHLYNVQEDGITKLLEEEQARGTGSLRKQALITHVAKTIPVNAPSDIISTSNTSISNGTNGTSVLNSPQENTVIKLSKKQRKKRNKIFKEQTANNSVIVATNELFVDIDKSTITIGTEMPAPQENSISKLSKKQRGKRNKALNNQAAQTYSESLVLTTATEFFDNLVVSSNNVELMHDEMNTSLNVCHKVKTSHRKKKQGGVVMEFYDNHYYAYAGGNLPNFLAFKEFYLNGQSYRSFQKLKDDIQTKQDDINKNPLLHYFSNLNYFIGDQRTNLFHMFFTRLLELGFQENILLKNENVITYIMLLLLSSELSRGLKYS